MKSWIINQPDCVASLFIQLLSHHFISDKIIQSFARTMIITHWRLKKMRKIKIGFIHWRKEENEGGRHQWKKRREGERCVPRHRDVWIHFSFGQISHVKVHCFIGHFNGGHWMWDTLKIVFLSDLLSKLLKFKNCFFIQH